jgi:hypothetical protein
LQEIISGECSFAAEILEVRIQNQRITAVLLPA